MSKAERESGIMEKKKGLADKLLDLAKKILSNLLIGLLKMNAGQIG